MTRKPLISVVLPVHNSEKYLREALDSILRQTFTDFELLAVNDGSDDDSLKILREYGARDARIAVFDQKNIGLVHTLNQTIHKAKGMYIARMDDDDISLPHRFELQIAAFKQNSTAVLVGGCFEVINEYGEYEQLDVLPVKNEDIKRALHLYNPLAHGSVMFKKSAFDQVGGYSDKVGPTEDFDLWCRMAKEGDYVGVSRVIFRWRRNPKGITHTQNKVMVQKTRDYTDRMWREDPPKRLTLSELRQRSRWYVTNFGVHGVKMKKVMLDNNSQIGMKMIRRGRIVAGVLQLVSVALVGRSGVKITYHRLKNTAKTLLSFRTKQSSNV